MIENGCSVAWLIRIADDWEWLQRWFNTNPTRVLRATETQIFCPITWDWIKYSISIVADKGLKKTLYTSARLKKGEVLYLETHSCRYELCFNGEKIVKATQLSQMHEGENEKNQNHALHSTNGERNDSENIIVDVFRWSRCKTPLPLKVMRSVGIPLPLEYVEMLES